MDTNEYLQSVLSGQSLGEDSAELKELQAERAKVEKLIRESFGSVPIIRYGGSKAKGSLIKESYDLDIVCYLPSESDAAGKTLQEIYENIRNCLNKSYYVEEKTSALRLKGNAADNYMRDFHIDVVPGRFTDESKSDCFIYQKSAEKCRLKTNLDTHIAHVKGSGVVDAIRLLKLWKTRKGLRVKQFVFELLIIDLLSGMKSKPLADQLLHVWNEIADHEEPIHVEDPANPNGNDLTDVMTTVWATLRVAATDTLNTIKWSGWEAVFGSVAAAKSFTVAERAQRATASVSTPNRPWCPRG
ncbi:hypothetical protein [Pseudacidobacterium ailaaui]|jgi:hypothetical protein|uniref:hypothetical protein n=1 Tax=Pseudacidobacterium ailaaui TaxID=1382359 RepID=UPI0012DDED0E|nr:hypothetical protein [Pseudacidobacterium ailaaui]